MWVELILWGVLAYVFGYAIYLSIMDIDEEE